MENQVYEECDLGKPKVVALAERIHAIDPTVRVRTFVGRLEDCRLRLDRYVLFGGFDAVAPRYLLSHLGVRRGAVVIDGGLRGFRGTVKVIIPGKTACQACYDTLPDVPFKASCSKNRIPSTYVTAAIVANLQVMQLIKLAHDQPVKSYLDIDVSRNYIDADTLVPNPKCEVCGDLQ